MIKYLYLLLMVVTFASCKKEAKSNNGLKEQMADSWYIRNLITNNYDAAGKLLTTVRTTGDSYVDFFDFTDNDTYNYSLQKGTIKSSGTYTINNTTSFVMRAGTINNPCTVNSLTLEEFLFVLKMPKVAGQPYTEVTYSLYR